MSRTRIQTKAQMVIWLMTTCQKIPQMKARRALLVNEDPSVMVVGMEVNADVWMTT
jgi:hypothetical protein